MELSYKNRIALLYIVTTAILILIIYLSIYFVVYKTVYQRLDKEIEQEAGEIMNDLKVKDDVIQFAQLSEWSEGEHGPVEVNPVFLQILDIKGNLLRKSDNLHNQTLSYIPQINQDDFINAELANTLVRQKQMMIKNTSGVLLGYLIVAVPLADTENVLLNLKSILAVSFPLVLLLLFFYSKYVAGSSIAPVNKIINTAERISKENLKERIELPERKDELYKLTNTINDLLDRIEVTLKREKQFISDVSHELRTPLSIIKGNLELLTRKQRTTEEYNQKILLAVDETDRMTLIIDQLMEIARFESSDLTLRKTDVNLYELMLRIIERYSDDLIVKNIEIINNIESDNIIRSDPAILEIIIGNIFSNALKYSDSHKKILLDSVKEKDNYSISITDEGIGIESEHLDKIFDRFYREDAAKKSGISGSGIGLSITKKLADILKVELNVRSEKNEGTTFILKIPIN